MLEPDFVFLGKNMAPSKRFSICLILVTAMILNMADAVRAADMMAIEKTGEDPQQKACQVHFMDDSLTVKAEDIPLKELLREIAHKSGLIIEGDELLENRITVNFKELTLDKGIRLILQNQNVAMVYTPQISERGQKPDLKLMMLKIVPAGGEESASKIEKLPKNVPENPQPATSAYK